MLCIVHSIQQSTLEGLKACDASPLPAKCRHIVGHFKHSSANTSELKISHVGTCKEDRTCPWIAQDVPMVWNSRGAMRQYHTDHPVNYSETEILNSNWEKTLKYMSVLNKLAEATHLSLFCVCVRACLPACLHMVKSIMQFCSSI